MLICQLTDIHIGFDRDSPREANMLRLEAVLDHLVRGPNRADLLLLTGDLTEFGEAESFDRLVAALGAFHGPILPIPGNHDARGPLLAAFPHAGSHDGFVQYAVEVNGLRLLMLDTLEVGRHGGGFCTTRARWLAAELAAHPEVPTLLAMHHPPFPAGIPWMDTDPREPWVARFAAAIAGHDQIVGIVCGHVHRATATHWHNQTVVICPSVAPAVGIDLNPIDPNVPDGRALITDEPAGFGLHRWHDGQLVTHFSWAGTPVVLARYDDTLQGMIRDMLAEQP